MAYEWFLLPIKYKYVIINTEVTMGRKIAFFRIVPTGKKFAIKIFGPRKGIIGYIKFGPFKAMGKQMVSRKLKGAYKWTSRRIAYQYTQAYGWQPLP